MRTKSKNKMIVKLQLSMGKKRKTMLIYNEDMSVRYEAVAPEAIIDMMDGELKAYFYSRYNEKTKQIELEEVAPWQEW